ncbi:unnamed protein product [Urochloa humidicola]
MLSSLSRIAVLPSGDGHGCRRPDIQGYAKRVAEAADARDGSTVGGQEGRHRAARTEETMSISSLISRSSWGTARPSSPASRTTSSRTRDQLKVVRRLLQRRQGLHDHVTWRNCWWL